MQKLATIAPLLIHKSQASFIQGHSIYDQIDLAQMMIDLCDTIEQAGIIIALDQEKAYN
jgi:hypothetical protein